MVQSGGRGRSVQKRAAMLDAAQELFLTEGYERTSIEAIAARARVSKRTVYDHFGDKELVYTAVRDRVSVALLDAVDAAIVEELPDGCDLREGLLAFVRRVTISAFSSSDRAFRRIVGARSGPSAGRPDTPAMTKDLVVGRFSRLIADGALRPADPGRAVEHFIALTVLLAFDTLDLTLADTELDAILVDGVDAFLRAYG